MVQRAQKDQLSTPEGWLPRTSTTEVESGVVAWIVIVMSLRGRLKEPNVTTVTVLPRPMNYSGHLHLRLLAFVIVVYLAGVRKL